MLVSGIISGEQYVYALYAAIPTAIAPLKIQPGHPGIKNGQHPD